MCGPEGGTQGPNPTPKAFSNARTLNPLEGRGRCLTRTTCSGASTSLDSRWRHCQRGGLRPSFQRELHSGKMEKENAITQRGFGWSLLLSAPGGLRSLPVTPAVITLRGAPWRKSRGSVSKRAT